ncbi:hypothetical protein QE177_05670 [Arsenophonus sp. aPb]|uniref:hypothetical protein n=1 Tax=Arsenophonus sp. aPb TaxID=3041619 RepID=UPI0024682B76|nr:hypothetical protein [Arsenophonus sp. aPb]WGL99363.1 hypothetical protein QE177_05670 [Arsenophonus sp. aPb]
MVSKRSVSRKKVITFSEKLEAKKKEGNSEFIQAFNENKKALELHIQLQEQMKTWREQAGLTSAEIAAKIGVIRQQYLNLKEMRTGQVSKE